MVEQESKEVNSLRILLIDSPLLMNVSVNSKEVNFAAVGLDPTPPKRLVPLTSALDHLATLPDTKG